MSFLDVPHDVLPLIADHVDSLSSFRLLCKKTAEIRQKPTPDPIRINRDGVRITNQTTASELEFLCQVDPNTLVIFEKFSWLTLERTRSFLPRLKRIQLRIHEPSRRIVELLHDALASLFDMVELRVDELPTAPAAYVKTGGPPDVGVTESVTAALQRSERTLSSVCISLRGVAARDLLACYARCPNLTAVDMVGVRVALNDETEALVTQLLRSHPALRTFNMLSQDYCWTHPEWCACHTVERLLCCPQLPLDTNTVLTPELMDALQALLPPDSSFPVVTELSVANGAGRTLRDHWSRLFVLFPAVRRLNYCISRKCTPLAANEWRAIEAGWPQLCYYRSSSSYYTTNLPTIVPGLCRRLEGYYPDSNNQLSLYEMAHLGPCLPNLRDVSLVSPSMQSSMSPAFGGSHDGVSQNLMDRERASSVTQSLACAPVLQRLTLDLPVSLLAEFIPHLQQLPALTTLALITMSPWTRKACRDAYDSLSSVVVCYASDLHGGTVSRAVCENIRAEKDKYLNTLLMESSACAIPGLIQRCFALCPALTELKCTLMPQDLAMLGSIPQCGLLTLRLSLYDLAPLVDSGLLRCFPLLRELTLEVVMFEMAQLMRLTAQCPQLVRLSVTFSPRIMGVSEILAFADVAALVSRLPYLRSLLLDLRMDYLSLDDICELIPDIERPETLILLPAVQLLLPVVQQLTTLGLHVDEELLHSLREDAPWCTIQRLTSSATVWEWSHVEQALRRSEQAHKRKLEEDSEASPQTRPKI